MSDDCIHIVPIHAGEYPNAESKAKEILKWFQDRDIVENELSDCTLGKEKGYRFKPNVRSLFKGDELWAYSDTLWTHGLEVVFDKRKIFHPVEGAYLELTCPDCKFKIDENIGYEWVSDWYESTGTDYPICPSCKEKRHLTEYEIEPEWAFSNIGISLWNTHWDLKPEFLSEMEKLLGMKVMVVPVRI